ncbi:MAG: hypothetical protein JRI46_11535 [Deltaproteobacteria bacterium]|nr:hypothetical protein [Deltaproteobacteria bacterium]
MKFLRGCLIPIITIALVMGCVPKRLPEAEMEKVPLSQALAAALSRYHGVSSLQARLFVKVEVREELHLLRGVLLYERPVRLRLRLTSTLGATVGEVIYSEGLLHIILPSEKKIYMGWIGQGDSRGGDTLILKMAYKDYQEIGGGRFPTRIYGEVEGKGIRFELRLKGPHVDLPLPEGAFVPITAGWEVYPLADLKGLLSKTGVEEGP